MCSSCRLHRQIKHTPSAYIEPLKRKRRRLFHQRELTTASSGERRNIYWGDKADHPKVEWKDENHVSINDKVLDVRSDTYDWRRE
ncbi:DUF5412 family protein [Bacillus sonorensis]|nr:DUF5412 family protein [Bacillus sonorensis]